MVIRPSMNSLYEGFAMQTNFFIFASANQIHCFRSGLCALKRIIPLPKWSPLLLLSTLYLVQNNPIASTTLNVSEICDLVIFPISLPHNTHILTISYPSLIHVLPISHQHITNISSIHYQYCTTHAYAKL